jgi:hypothetical protein
LPRLPPLRTAFPGRSQAHPYRDRPTRKADPHRDDRRSRAAVAADGHVRAGEGVARGRIGRKTPMGIVDAPACISRATAASSSRFANKRTSAEEEAAHRCAEEVAPNRLRPPGPNRRKTVPSGAVKFGYRWPQGRGGGRQAIARDLEGTPNGAVTVPNAQESCQQSVAIGNALPLRAVVAATACPEPESRRAHMVKPYLLLANDPPAP